MMGPNDELLVCPLDAIVATCDLLNVVPIVNGLTWIDTAKRRVDPFVTGSMWLRDGTASYCKHRLPSRACSSRRPPSDQDVAVAPGCTAAVPVTRRAVAHGGRRQPPRWRGADVASLSSSGRLVAPGAGGALWPGGGGAHARGRRRGAERAVEAGVAHAAVGGDEVGAGGGLGGCSRLQALSLVTFPREDP